MNKMQKLTAITLAMGLLVACAPETVAPSTVLPQVQHIPITQQEQGTLTVYSPLPEEELALYSSAFYKDTGIRIAYTRLSAGEMIERVRQEQDAPRASVLLGGAADNYVQANAYGVLTPYQSAQLANVAEAYLDTAGVWNPIYLGVIGFACNTQWFAKMDLPLPTRWDDLLSPALAGQIVQASPVTSGTAYTMLAALAQQRGEADMWTYLHALHDNVGRYTRSGVEPMQRVKDGEYAVGIVFSHDGRRAMLDGYPVQMEFPEDGTGYEIGACALVRGGPEEERAYAETFIDWITSSRGQECYIEAKSSRLPTNGVARSADGLPALRDLNLIVYDAQWAGENRARLTAQFAQTFESAQIREDSP